MKLERQDTAESAWAALRRFTPARVALGRAGGSLPTSALLDLRLAHARARDALARTLDEDNFVREIGVACGCSVLRLRTAAADLQEYLRRPELGRRLSAESAAALKEQRGDWDLAVIVSEGLSPLALQRHAAGVLRELWPMLKRDGWRVAPLCFVRRGRVAVEDEIGACLGTSVAVMLLGERPGLLSPDSLGAYLVYEPRPGKTDAERNCVSNINAHGLTHSDAARKLHWLLSEARRKRISGVRLKDECRAVRGLTG